MDSSNIGPGPDGADLVDRGPGTRIYTSSSGFMWGNQPVGNYDSPCLRSIAWKSHNRDVATSIPVAYAMVGSVHESNHEHILLGNTDPFQREVPIRTPIDTRSGKTIVYSGRCDFIFGDSIDETKATFSKSAPNYILRKGQWKISHLAQLAGYLWQKDMIKGRIVYGVYSNLAEGAASFFKHIGTRIFNVAIEDDGRLTVDSKPTPYYVQDQIAHVYAAAEAVAEKKVWPVRPWGWEQKWGSPCALCPFKALCDSFESGNISESETFTKARSILQGDT